MARAQAPRGRTCSAWCSLLTQARYCGALSHSLVMSHCEGFSKDWQSWSLMCPGSDAMSWRICS